MAKPFEIIIVGGGFYGLRLAQFCKEELKADRVLVIEKEAQVMKRASYNNQARVHNGYHYPRSILTALRSRVNFPIFCTEYNAAIVDDFDKYYGVATLLSKVSAKQFERFCQRVGADIAPAPEVKSLFNPKFIEDIFKVKEYAFNADILRDMLLENLKKLAIPIKTNEEAICILNDPKNGILLKTDKMGYHTKFLINTTYSSINILNKQSGLPIVPLKHELTEMCLVTVPPILEGKAFTIMCGPFFSLMPFPARNMYTLSHVRYTPHNEWSDNVESVKDGQDYLLHHPTNTNFKEMISDVQRYIPIAGGIKYSGESLWEIKTVLPQSESDDSRPILYLKDHGGIKNYICIMGGKIDNIYDAFKELRDNYEKEV